MNDKADFRPVTMPNYFILLTMYHWMLSDLFIPPADLQAENCSQKGSQSPVAKTWYELGQRF